MKIVLIDDGAAEQPLRAENEVKCFTDSRFTGVIAANKKRMGREVHYTLFDAAKILYSKLSDPQ